MHSRCIPRWPCGVRFRMHCSSRPDGLRTVATRLAMSSSEMAAPEKGSAISPWPVAPIVSCARRRASPTTRAVNGEPAMCRSWNLMLTTYSPGSEGVKLQRQVPSRWSVHLISAFDGPSTAIARPPARAHAHHTSTIVRYTAPVPCTSTRTASGNRNRNRNRHRSCIQMRHPLRVLSILIHQSSRPTASRSSISNKRAQNVWDRILARILAVNTVITSR